MGADPGALRRVLRALVSFGTFAETAEGTFTATPLADLLRSDAPGSLRPLAVLYGEDWLWQAYGRILTSVQTGRPGFEDAHGIPFYEYLEIDRAAGRTFDEAMTGYSALEAEAILAAYDFSPVGRVIDVGGGHGALLASLLKAHAHLSGLLFDRQSVVETAGRADRTTAIQLRMKSLAHGNHARCRNDAARRAPTGLGDRAEEGIIDCAAPSSCG
ncbi:MAG: hypothetical protein M3461_22550 [Pseudomonadota bacterium]|nr:hypothetical protein [Pseudomonadota bacterium]